MKKKKNSKEGTAESCSPADLKYQENNVWPVLVRYISYDGENFLKLNNLKSPITRKRQDMYCMWKRICQNILWHIFFEKKDKYFKVCRTSYCCQFYHPLAFSYWLRAHMSWDTDDRAIAMALSPSSTMVNFYTFLILNYSLLLQNRSTDFD